MKHLEAIHEDIEQLASRLDLEISQLSGYGDDSYRIDLKTKKPDPHPIGFDHEDRP